ncbi:MAG: VanZ family protein [Deltaproteobacteria bacterium]|nr:VanZ family protein [Deltaproteobacteria bacterium]MBW1952039.1 VanZ family protein [Deltaproteobacteria bacterium]MBW1986932.1 VanZ family protein [Deltaproteobacteria bacterium]MBW2134079.1 VanZ family protein [Deltaproteobacteria bacterium]
MFNAFKYFRFKAFCFYWLPPLLLTGLILLFSGELGSVEYTQAIIKLIWPWFPSMNGKLANLLHFFLRKGGHFIIYAMLFVAWVRPLRWALGFSPLLAIFLALMINLGVALTDEGNQARIESRTANPRDILLDISGALTATLIIFPVLRQASVGKNSK